MELDFNEIIDPITGEINWDCECLEGQPNGPCGQVFKNAFKCFIDNKGDISKCSALFEILNKCQNELD